MPAFSPPYSHVNHELFLGYGLFAFVVGQQSSEPPGSGMKPIRVAMGTLAVLPSKSPRRRDVRHKLAILVLHIEGFTNVRGGSSSSSAGSLGC